MKKHKQKQIAAPVTNVEETALVVVHEPHEAPEPAVVETPKTPEEMQAMVVAVLGPDGVYFTKDSWDGVATSKPRTGTRYSVGVPAAKYPKRKQTDWKKWIENGIVRWGSGETLEAALRYAGGARGTTARARVAAEMAAAAAQPKALPATTEEPAA
jgi:hypothetical protein